MSIIDQITRRLQRRQKLDQRREVTFLYTEAGGVSVYSVGDNRVRITRQGVVITGSDRDRDTLAAHLHAKQVEGDNWRRLAGLPVQAPLYPYGVL